MGDGGEKTDRGIEMKAPTIAGIFLLTSILAGFTLFGQETEGWIESEEPVLILPDVVIQLVDTGEVQIAGGLPEEENLLAREGEIPLPGAAVVLNLDPVLTMPPLDAPEYGESSFLAEVILGLGNKNLLLSEISLYKVGDKPRYNIQFKHRQMDGFSSHLPGSGYDMREDELIGTLKLGSSDFNTELSGSYHEEERGQQGWGIYRSRIIRSFKGNIEFSRSWTDLFGLKLSLPALYSLSLQTGLSPDLEGEFRLQPRLEAGLSWTSLKIGTRLEYGFNNLQLASDFISHSFRADAYLSWDLPFGVSIAGEGGYFRSASAGNQAPFRIELSGIPWPFLGFRLIGGYRVEQIYTGDLLESYPRSYIQSLPADSYGWFAEASLMGRIGTRWVLNGSLAYEDKSRLFYPLSTPADLDPIKGLYPFTNNKAESIHMDLGLRWNRNDLLEFAVQWKVELMPLPTDIIPADTLQLEGMLSDENDKLRFEVSLLFENLIGVGFQMPEMGLSGTIHLTDPIFVKIAGEDLLRFLSSEPNYSHYPFEEPGMRGSVVVEIRL
jgi:hypothetical protein